MFDYDLIKKEVLANLDFLPDDAQVRDSFFENLLRLLMYP